MRLVGGTAWRRDTRYGSAGQFTERGTWIYIFNDIEASNHRCEASTSACSDEDIHGGLKVKKGALCHPLCILYKYIDGKTNIHGDLEGGWDLSLEIKFGWIVYPFLL